MVRSLRFLTGCSLISGCAYPAFSFAADTSPAVADTAVVAADTTVTVPETSAETSAETAAETDTSVADACTACGATERCITGGCHPHPSCAALQAAQPALPSGIYTIDPDGAGSVASFAVYCDKADGGGWTLAAKLDGAKKTWVYDSPLWTDGETLNPIATAFDTTEAKFASFISMPFSSVRLGMVQAGTRRFIRIDASGTSLRALFNGPSVSTSLGRTAWMTLVADARLQPNCDAEGFNRDFSALTSKFTARARIGVFGNDETDCNTPDSYLGFGGGFGAPYSCVEPDPGVVVGNFNPLGCGGSAGNDRTTPTFGYIFIR